MKLNEKERKVSSIRLIDYIAERRRELGSDSTRSIDVPFMQQNSGGRRPDHFILRRK
jgi:hypothetical protein